LRAAPDPARRPNGGNQGVDQVEEEDCLPPQTEPGAETAGQQGVASFRKSTGAVIAETATKT